VPWAIISSIQILFFDPPVFRSFKRNRQERSHHGGRNSPCMIGEFGESGKEKNTDWAALVNYAKKLNWPVLGWSFNGDGGIMNMIIQNTPLLDNGRNSSHS
jgi:hypothetical protein